MHHHARQAREPRSVVTSLELELVEAVALRETPRSLEVLREVVDLLDSGKNGGVDGLLLRLLLLGEGLLLGTLAEELALLGSLGGLGLDEVGVVDGLGDLDVGDLNLGRGGDNVSLRDATEGDTVELEGAGDKEETRVELLKEDNTATSEAASEEDQDSAGGDRSTELGLAGLLARDLGDTDVLGGVELRSLLGGDDALLAVGLAADLLLDGGGDLSLGRDLGGLLACRKKLEHDIFVGTMAWHGAGRLFALSCRGHWRVSCGQECCTLLRKRLGLLLAKDVSRPQEGSVI